MGLSQSMPLGDNGPAINVAKVGGRGKVLNFVYHIVINK